MIDTEFSPDGRYVTTGTRHRTAAIWDAETGRRMDGVCSMSNRWKMLAAVAMSLHRMRRCYGELLREEVAATVGDESDIEEEL